MTLQSGASIATAHEPLSARLGSVALPRGLKEAVEIMPWSMFTATYSPTAGPLRLGSFECADDRPATRRGPEPRTYTATFAIGDRIETASTEATGPVAALTAMLFDRGIKFEMIRFHQLASGPDTVTCIQGSDGLRAEWAVGWSEEPTESALRALIACANRLAMPAYSSK